MNTITLNETQVKTLLPVIKRQYEIAKDTITEELYVENDVSLEEMKEICKSMESRVDILIILTHTLGMLQSSIHKERSLYVNDKDLKILENEITYGIKMSMEQLDEYIDNFDVLKINVDIIVDLKVILGKFKSTEK